MALIRIRENEYVLITRGQGWFLQSFLAIYYLDNMNELKERHGCVNVWLWLVVGLNLCLCIYYLIELFDGGTNRMLWGIGLLTVLALGNVLGAILLLRWNKCGFYLLMICSILIAVVNIWILQIDVAQSIAGLAGILIWWGILHMKKNGIPAWKLMDGGWDYKHCRHLYQLFGFIAAGLLVTTIIVCTKNARPSLDSVIIDDDELFIDSTAYEEVVDEIQWKKFSDDGNSCSIDAPDDFRKAELNVDQLLGLMCSDYDPAVIIIKESNSDVKSVGINSPKEYAELFVKQYRYAEGASNFKTLSSDEYGANSYLVAFNETIDGTDFRYHVLATKTSSNFYCCMIFCLSEYSDRLQQTIDHMLNSFKANR